MPWSAGPPTGLIQSASESIGSGNSIVLLAGTINVKGIKLWSLSISSAMSSVGGGPGSSFVVDDTVSDNTGTQYLACEIGLPSGTESGSTNSVSQDMAGIVLPAGATLSLNNGGAGGTSSLHRCSATVIYSILY